MLREDFIFYVILLRINILLLRGGGVPILAEFIGLQRLQNDIILTKAASKIQGIVNTINKGKVT